MRNYSEVGLQAPDILLPNNSVSLAKWAVVACDQFTSQPEYWDQVKQISDGSPSTFHLVLPEAYLGTSKESKHQSQISSSMRSYLEAGLFDAFQGFVYIERTLGKRTRQGLIAAVDLEQYDFHKESQSLIRATEGTILDRLPPRVAIRKNALLEIPHILILIDDPRFTVIEPLADKAKTLQTLYGFDLMLGGGHVKGILIDDLQLERNIVSSLEGLTDRDLQEQKYGAGTSPLLYAVGDGNHSLAAAKSYWEKIKGKVTPDHPARFALVEIVNIHNNGIVFEPIHRLVKNFTGDIRKSLSSFFSNAVNFVKVDGFHNLVALVKNQDTNPQKIGWISKDNFYVIEILKPLHTLPVGSMQLYLDDLFSAHSEMFIDFIHGDDALFQLGSQPNNFGFYFPAMQKTSLFRSVIQDGPLPRKTFSMGEANEKRYYLECRKIQIDEP